MYYPRRARKGEHNYPLIDKYTTVHATVGACMALADAPPWMAFAATFIWEVAEPQLKAQMPQVFPKSTRDTPQNKIGDSVAFMAAYYATRKARLVDSGG